MRTIHLIRHAIAQPREGWSDPDHLRPLTKRGLMQAERIAEILGGQPIAQVRSSPALRCTQTVQPLCDQVNLELVVDENLFEGRAIDFPAEEGIHVLCAHGDNIPAALGEFGVDCGKCRKGSIWTLEFEGDALRDSRYVEVEA